MTLEESGEEWSPTRPLNSTVTLTPSVRSRPMIHPCVDPPVCEDCQKLELSFFDPGCPGCHEILISPLTKVPEVFAILRQWTPQTQKNIDLLVNEVCHCLGLDGFYTGWVLLFFLPYFGFILYIL